MGCQMSLIFHDSHSSGKLSQQDDKIEVMMIPRGYHKVVIDCQSYHKVVTRAVTEMSEGC